MSTEITIRVESSTPKSTPFNFQNNPVRIFMIDGEPWFVAVDVCKAIGIGNARMAIQKLDNDERTQVIDSNTVNSTDGSQINNLLNVVSESGMNALVLRCRDAMTQGTPAHTFRKWVTAEVLPTIRKTGTYSLPPVQPATISKQQHGDLLAAIRKVSKGTQYPRGIEKKLANYLKCTFNADPLPKMQESHFAAAMGFLDSAFLRVGGIRTIYREMEEIAVREFITGSMPSLPHLKGKFRELLEQELGRPVDVHEILVHDYAERHGLVLSARRASV